MRHVLLPLAIFSSLCVGGTQADEQTPPPPAPSEGMDKKIGQMIMVGFRGTEVSKKSPIYAQIKRGNVGGVVLFNFDQESGEAGRNIESPEQLQALTTGLQKATRSKVFIAIDQEGGEVSHLHQGNGFPLSLAAEDLGRFDRPGLTRKLADKMAQAMRKVGINFLLGPVVDVKCEGAAIAAKKRAFSADPEVVVRHAREVILAMQEHNILCTLKHFPGLGRGMGDTHYEPVDLSETWEVEELSPFTKLTRERLGDGVMVGHCFNTNLDPHLPASLSKQVIRDLLRRGINFKKLVITDDLQMEAISGSFEERQIVKQALLAGVDILLFANQQVYDEAIAPRIVATVKDLIDKGEVPKEMIEDSYKRILAAKKKILKSLPSPEEPQESEEKE